VESMSGRRSESRMLNRDTPTPVMDSEA